MKRSTKERLLVTGIMATLVVGVAAPRYVARSAHPAPTLRAARPVAGVIALPVTQRPVPWPLRASRNEVRKPLHHKKAHSTTARAPRRPAPPPNPQVSTTTIGWPWGPLVQCEAGGNWHINTGNGFYGGPQFTQPSWENYGGLAFASRADLAAPSQQVIVAKKVLAAQGWGAWPVCSHTIGAR